MNQRKLEEYRLTGSIHTLSIASKDVPPEHVQFDEYLERCVTSSSKRKYGWRFIINPNKLNGDIFTYPEFETVLDTILEGIGTHEYEIIRADLRLDSYERADYRRFAKLNKYLICMLAISQGTLKNAYNTKHLFNQNQLSIAVKSRDYEIENYDKDAESGGKDLAKARLEERSIKRNKGLDIEYEFMTAWKNRWNKALQCTDEVSKVYNNHLEEIYNREKDAFPVRFKNLTDFLIQYQDCIFTHKQLIDLLARLPEVKNPVEKAKYHKKKYGIEYFTKGDVKKALAEIQRATAAYFEPKEG